MLGPQEANRGGYVWEPEGAQGDMDSGIDSDGTPRRTRRPTRYLALRRYEKLRDCSSSDEDPIIVQPLPKGNRNKDFDQLRNGNENERNNIAEEFPLLQRRHADIFQGAYNMPVLDDSPGKSSLYEVELTASDEDDDASLLEVVFPLQPKINGAATIQKKDRHLGDTLYRIFCCRYATSIASQNQLREK